MQKLFPWSMLFSAFLLLAACGDGTRGAQKTDGGDAAAGTTAAGTGGTLSTGGNGAGSGGLLGAGGSTPGTGGNWGTDAGQSDSNVPATEDSSTGQICTYNGRSYPEWTSWFAADGCNECTCLGGRAGCSLIPCGADAGGQPSYSCDYNGKSHPYGATFPSTDGCNICECGFFWYRDNPPGPIFVSCTSKDCSSSPVGDAGPGIDACVYNGKAYPLDVYFPSEDGCDECHCRTDGQVTCTFQHIGCRSDAGMPDGSVDVQVGPDAPLDSTVAPGCDVVAARAAMTARGLVVTGSAETLNDTLPSVIDGPNWGLKSTACQDGGYDISGLAGQTVCLVKQPIAQACAQSPYLAWALMSGGAVKCVYKSDDTNPGIYAVDDGYACP